MSIQCEKFPFCLKIHGEECSENGLQFYHLLLLVPLHCFPRGSLSERKTAQRVKLHNVWDKHVSNKAARMSW